MIDCVDENHIYDWSQMMITLTVPTGRGKLSRSGKTWAKTVDSISKNARSGHDWSGEWLTQGTDCEVNLGDIIVVGDKDGEGACVYMAAKVVRWTDNGPCLKNELFRLDCDNSKSWASAMSVETRRYLKMDADERQAEVNSLRKVQLDEIIPKAKIADTYDWSTVSGKVNIPSAEAITRVEAMIAFMSTPTVATDPKADAIATIRKLMADNGITIDDIATLTPA